MGRRGPKPTPTAMLKLTGSWRADARKSEPKPKLGAPPMPTWLATEAKAEWKRVVPQLQKLGVITLIDRTALALYCQAWADYHDAVAVVKVEGKTFTTPTGYIAKNPLVTIMNKARAAVLRLAQDFGFTPSALARLGTPHLENPPGRHRRFFPAAA